MENDNSSISPDAITSVSNAIQQSIPKTLEQTDNALSTVVGFFNNVVLYPIKRANMTFKYKLEAFEDDLRKKVEQIPKENLQIPPVMIAGPTLEALRYAYDEESLREMYESLLACAMDNRKVVEAHPAFVDAIKQMNPLDALVFKKLVELRPARSGEILFKIANTTSAYPDAMPYYFVEELCDLSDPFVVSASIENLSRLALIKTTSDVFPGADYSAMKNHPYVRNRLNLYKHLGKELIVIVNEHSIVLTDYGRQFARVCLNS